MIADAAESTRIKLGAVSDTHDDFDYIKTAIPHFRPEGVDAVAHCGDIVAPFLAAPLDAGFDFHAVHGSNDGEWTLRKAAESLGIHHGDFAHLTLDSQEITAHHGTKAESVDAFVDSGTYDFALHGYSRERVVEHRGATTHINPGGLPVLGTDDVFHVAVMDLNAGNMASRPL